jgi:DNA repair protein RadC
MGEQPVWAVLIGACGGERARIPLADSTARAELPLRRIAEEGLRLDAVAVILLRPASNIDCVPCTQEWSAIRTAKTTLGQIGLRLHDYILWQGDQCVSLRQTGQI